MPLNHLVPSRQLCQNYIVILWFADGEFVVTKIKVNVYQYVLWEAHFWTRNKEEKGVNLAFLAREKATQHKGYPWDGNDCGPFSSAS